MHLKQMVRDLEQRRDEERRRREEDEVEERRRREEGECEVGGWEGVRETVKSALHLPPLTEKEYISLRGRERGEEREEGHTQSLTDYIRVSLTTRKRARSRKTGKSLFYMKKSLLKYDGKCCSCGNICKYAIKLKLRPL